MSKQDSLSGTGSTAGGSTSAGGSSSHDPSQSSSPVPIKNKLQSLAATHIALRGHLTRRIAIAHMLCELVEQIGAPTMSLLAYLKKAQDHLCDMFTKVEISSQELMTLDKPTKLDSWQTKLSEDEHTFRKQEGELITTIAEAELRIAASAFEN